MTPLSSITDRLPRAARDIARKRNRDVELVITGAEIELDRAILDELSDPLLHLLRNCIDHGIESPEERVAARQGPRRAAGARPGQPRPRPGAGGDRGRRPRDGPGEAQGRRGRARADHRRGRGAAAPTSEALLLCALPGRLHREGRDRHLRPRRRDGRGEAHRRERGRHARDRLRARARHPVHARACRSPSRWSTCSWSGSATRCSGCRSPRCRARSRPSTARSRAAADRAAPAGGTSCSRCTSCATLLSVPGAAAGRARAPTW